MTRATVDQLLTRIGAGAAPEEIAAVYAEVVDWQLDWPEADHEGPVPWIRHRTTRADVADHYRSLTAHHDPDGAGFELRRVLVDGTDAVVLGTIVNTVRRTGQSYRAHVALHLTVEDGLITRHHVYEDSLAVARAWGAVPAEPARALP